MPKALRTELALKPLLPPPILRLFSLIFSWRSRGQLGEYDTHTERRENFV
jgi:hypothetical protein